MIKEAGIYRIVNLIASEENINKGYIGSAINLSKRKTQHFSSLKLGYHSNKHLQNAFNLLKEQYKENAIDYFQWEVLEVVPKIGDIPEFKRSLLDREQYYIDKFSVCNDKYGYNFCTQAGSSLGVKHSEDYCKRISEWSKGNQFARGYKHTGEVKKLLSEINRERYKNNPKLIEEFKKRMKDRVRTKEERNKISKALKGRPSPMKGRNHTEEAKKKISESQYKKVINLTTNEVFNSLKEAAKNYPETTRSSIGSVCAGRYKTAGGFRWAFYENNDVI